MASARTPGWFQGRWKLVFATALAVRFLLILWSQSGWYSLSPPLLSDYYFRQGYAISAGIGYVDALTEPASTYLHDIEDRVEAGSLVATPQSVGPAPAGLHATAVHPPGMPLLIAGLHRLFEMPADIPVQLVGALLDSAAAVMVLWIAGTLVSPTAGLIAGLLYSAFLPQAWAATGMQMPDGLIGPFVVAMLFAYVRAVTTAGAAKFGWYAVAGLALGIGSYLRSDYLLAPIAMFPFLWMHLRRFTEAAGATVVVMAVALAVLSPWAYRNHSVFDRWIFTSSAPGATMISGLGAFDNPWGFGPSDTDRQREAEAAGYLRAWLPDADQYFRRIWLDSVTSDPGAYVWISLKKLPIGLAPPLEFGFDNPHKTRTFTDFRKEGKDRYAAVLSQPGYILSAYWETLVMAAALALALLASFVWVLLERQRWPLALLVLSPHLYSIAVHALTGMEPKYIVGSAFVLLIGSSAMIVELARRQRPSVSAAGT